MATREQVIKNEIDLDPVTLSYLALSNPANDGANLNIINNTDGANPRPSDRTVTAGDVRQYLSEQAKGTGANARVTLAMLQEFADAGTVRGADWTAPAGDKARRQSAAKMIWVNLTNVPEAVFRVDQTVVRTAFIDLGPDGGDGPSVFDSGELNGIDDLANQDISRSQELGLGTVTYGDLQRARALP